MRLHETLDEFDSRELIARYGVPTAHSVVCTDPGMLPEIAGAIPFPWVMKIISRDILHKTDAGCVRLGVQSIGAAEAACGEILANAKKHSPHARIRGVLIQEMINDHDLELIMGLSRDPQFGPVVMLGLGGIYVEIFKMVSMRLVPLTAYDAHQMISELAISKIFDGVRGKTYNKAEIVTSLLALSRLAEEHPEVSEVDINPYLVREQGGKAVDSVVVV